MKRDILIAGEAIIDFIPDQSGELETVESFSRRAGGAPANVAAGLAALDRAAWLWSAVGSDPFGSYLVDKLEKYGVSSRYIERHAEAKTALAFVSYNRGNGPSFTFYRNRTADTRLKPSNIPKTAVESVDWVHFSGVALARSPAREAMFSLAQKARENECIISFDPNARPELWTDFDYEESVIRAFELADVVKATPTDLKPLGMDANPEVLTREVCELGPHTTVLTLGNKGAVASATEESPWTDTALHPGYDISTVDTTGAGDAFTAGLITALTTGKSLLDTLAFANAVAALTTTAKGGMRALPDREEVKEFRNNNA